MDCADRDRIDEAKQELHRIINDREMKDAIILIFANKQDLPDGELIRLLDSKTLRVFFLISSYYKNYILKLHTQEAMLVLLVGRV